MPRYIDAEALNLYDDLFMSKDTINKSGVYVRYRVVENLIKNAPTADVQEVKHAEWIVEDKYTDHKTLRCSECGWIFNRDYIQPKDEYCSHCGAKMDGKENDK